MARSEPVLIIPSYILIRSRRRTIALLVRPDNQLEIRCGLHTARSVIDQFVRAKQPWIVRKQAENLHRIPIHTGTGADLERLRQTTRSKTEMILAAYPAFKPAKLTIRRQKKRWGSCSRSGSIAINVCAGHLPSELLEYIVVHELCHLIHFDHGPHFYALLSHWLPDAKARRQQLKQYVLV